MNFILSILFCLILLQKWITVGSLEADFDFEKSESEEQAKQQTIEDLKKKSNRVIIGPRCIPLTSKNIEANPYHPSLLSIPGKQIRNGYGLPIALPVNPIKCDKDISKGCPVSINKQIQVSHTIGYSISFSSTKGFSKSISEAKTDGTSNSFTNSIGKAIESSLSKTLTSSNDVALSEQISNSLTKNHEKSSGISDTTSVDESDTSTISQDTTTTDTTNTEFSLSKTVSEEFSRSKSEGHSRSNTNTVSQESTHSANVNVEAGFSFFGASVSVSAGYSYSNTNSQSSSETSETSVNTQETNSNSNSNTESSTHGSSSSRATGIGKSNAKTKSLGSSSSKDNRESDSISKSLEVAKTNTASTSKSEAESNSLSNSYRIDDSFSSSKENSITATNSDSIEQSDVSGKEVSKQTVTSETLTVENSFEIPPGKCKAFVGLRFVHAMSIAFECIDENSISTKRIFADYLFTDFTRNVSEPLHVTTVDCDKMNNKKLFMLDNTEYNDANFQNSVQYGELIYKGPVMQSNNGKFTLELKPNGKLVLKRHAIEIWDNGMGLFDDHEYPIRIRINEKGHLIEEVKGLFSDSAPEYREDEWIQVWSTAPINHDVTIGIALDHNNGKSYQLILEDSGMLNLYDAVGVLIWCATSFGHQECKHRFGYKFPELYLVPKNVIDLEEDPKDRHNSIDRNIKFLKNIDSIKSLDYNCSSYLMSNQGIVSKNGRFRLILEKSGNLIIKDAYTTMWESASGFLSYAEEPFKLVISPIGNIHILDSNNLIVWTSVVDIVNSSNPYELKLLDSGSVVVFDKNEKIIWESVPLRNMSVGNTILTKFRYEYKSCHGENNQRSNITRMIKSNSRETIKIMESLVSRNGLHSLKIEDDKLLLNSKTLVTDKNGIMLKFLKIQDDGTLVLVNIKNETVWKSNSRNFAGVYKTIVTDKGEIKILNKSDHQVWSLGACDSYYSNTKKNNTCDDISREHKLSVKQLSDLNPKSNCSTLLLGEIICIPDIKIKIRNDFRLFNHFEEIPKLSSKSCLIKCKSIEKCRAISFKNGQCFLFDGNLQGKNLKGWETHSFIDTKFIKPIINKNVRLMNHFREMKWKSPDDCWNECNKNFDCIASATKDSNCFLYNASSKAIAENKWQTYSIHPLTVYERKQNIHLWNSKNNFEKRFFDSVEECLDECQKMKHCIAISFYHEKCLLFDHYDREKKENDWISYIRKHV